MSRMLEVLIPGKKICKLEFRSTEQHGLSVSDKIINFEAVCTSDTGEMFIVEMQGLPPPSHGLQPSSHLCGESCELCHWA